ncbi:MAG: hypothetical protein AAGN82_11095 [Myxococcota bacterium]
MESPTPEPPPPPDPWVLPPRCTHGPEDVIAEGTMVVLCGTPEADELTAGAGDDVVNGWGGDDRLAGGAGNDLYVVRPGGDVVIDDAAGAYDRLWVVGVPPAEIAIETEGDDVVVTRVPASASPPLRVTIRGAGAIEHIEVEDASRDRFDDLDFGLYWLGPDGAREKDIPSVAHPYFDPTRPSFVYVHGWQSGTTAGRQREGLAEFAEGAAEGPDLDFVARWRGAGFNVGVFYWNQLADEGEVKDAEAKIWTTDGPRAMRFRRVDESYDTVAGLPPVARSLRNAWLHAHLGAVSLDPPPAHRVAGHSLGNQLAVAAVGEIYDAVDDGRVSAVLAPRRVALLDPFWSKGDKGYLGDTTPHQAVTAITAELFARGLSFELYRSTPLDLGFVGDGSDAIDAYVCRVDHEADYFGLFQLVQKHFAAVWLYLWSLDGPPPEDDQGRSVCSAASDPAALRVAAQGDVRWQQVTGENTQTPFDDGYEPRTKRLPPSP